MTGGRRLPQSAHDVEAKAQKHPSHHAHDDRHGQSRHQTLDPTTQAQHQHQSTGDIKGTDHLGKGQVLQGRADQHRARTRPAKGQRRGVTPAHQHADQAVDKKHPEHPGRQLLWRQATPGAHRQHHRHRASGRKNKANQRIGGVGAAKVGQDLSPSALGQQGVFKLIQQRPFPSKIKPQQTQVNCRTTACNCGAMCWRNQVSSSSRP